MTRFHLAQANIGRFRAPLEHPIMEGFRTQLDPMNELADRSPGFIWRLQTEDGNATAIRPYAGDDLMAINMSVWESLASLQQFVYRSAHVETLRGRKQWFEQIEGPILVLWWIPAGQIPTVSDAQERLQYLKENGPTPRAFTFRTPFPAPDQQTGDVDGLDNAFCEWAAHDEPPGE
jgi:heme-degrading monooxygenase HmoA